MSGAGRLSWQVLHEFYWNAVKKMGLEPIQAREIVEDEAGGHFSRVVTTSLVLGGSGTTGLLGRAHFGSCPALRCTVLAVGRLPTVIADVRKFRF